MKLNADVGESLWETRESRRAIFPVSSRRRTGELVRHTTSRLEESIAWRQMAQAHCRASDESFSASTNERGILDEGSLVATLSLSLSLPLLVTSLRRSIIRSPLLVVANQSIRSLEFLRL